MYVGELIIDTAINSQIHTPKYCFDLPFAFTVLWIKFTCVTENVVCRGNSTGSFLELGGVVFISVGAEKENNKKKNPLIMAR